MPVRLVPLADADPSAVEALLDAAFGDDRRVRTAYRLRDRTCPIAPLSFAAFDGNVLVGSLQSWPVALDETPLILVGPVAVAPDRQRGGIGRMLMERLLSVVVASPHHPLVMIGDPEYYGRFFGFDATPTQDWSLPGPVERRRLLVRTETQLPRYGRLRPRVFELASVVS